ncbi:hypothetical protein MPSEU_000660900 [Mayamaea pseudoterrestris]|nr:hypothetical protein MPSEU_000660900 [Mayamaea pseudoterrestris]
MGSVIGKTGVAEPAYEVLFKQHASDTFPYEIRKYGQRFAAQATFTSNDGDDRSTPFRLLAKYIGVFGTPENEGSKAIAMTAPVAISDKPTSIAMTAPVIMSNKDATTKTMDFILPAEYDSLEKIPKPTNPAVMIHAIPPQVGAVHQYSGSMRENDCKNKATQLVKQLQKDGVKELTEDQALQNYEYWGYNPPFTLPMFRRNEVWIPLDEAQVASLVSGTGGVGSATGVTDIN